MPDFNTESKHYKYRKEYTLLHPEDRLCSKGCGFNGPVLNPKNPELGYKVEISRAGNYHVGKQCLTCFNKNRRKKRRAKSNMDIKPHKIKAEKNLKTSNDIRQMSDDAIISVVNKMWKCKCGVWNRGNRKKCRGCNKNKPWSK